MQLSCKKGIGFLCVPKCGSTTVERFMRPHSDVSLSGNPNLKHLRYVTLEKYVFPMLGESRVKKPYIFAVVREPVSWVESWYRFRGRKELEPKNHPQHHNYSGGMSFEEYAEEVLNPRPKSYARIHSQFHYLHAQDGSLGVDQIIPLERISSDVPKLLANYGIEVAKPDERKNVSEKREASKLPAALKLRLQEHLQKDCALYADCFTKP